MTEIRGRIASNSPGGSLIEQTPPHAGPSALTLVQHVDAELDALASKEAVIGRSTSHTRWKRQQLLQRRDTMARLVN